MKNSMKLPANYSCILSDEQKLISGGRPPRGGGLFFGNLIYDLLSGFNIYFGKRIDVTDTNTSYKNGGGTSTGSTTSQTTEYGGISGNINLGTIFWDLFFPHRW